MLKLSFYIEKSELSTHKSYSKQEKLTYWEIHLIVLSVNYVTTIVFLHFNTSPDGLNASTTTM